jgi:hypothetical protein
MVHRQECLQRGVHAILTNEMPKVFVKDVHGTLSTL